MVAGDADDRPAGRQVAELRVQRLDRALLDLRVLRVARQVGRLQVREDERVAVVELLASQLQAGAQVGRCVAGLWNVPRLQADRPREAEQELRVAEEAAVQAVALAEARVRPAPAPPLERDHVQRREPVRGAALVDRMALEQLDRLARPGLGGAGRALGLWNLRLRPEHRVPVLEEGVRVGDAVVGAGEHAEDRLAALQVRELEPQAFDLEPVARGHELGGVLLVLASFARPSGEPQPVVAPLGRAQRREREHVPRVDLLLRAGRLEHRPARELVRCVAEHRPVRQLARRRAPRAEAEHEPARALRCEAVEIRRLGDLVRGSPAERVVRSVGEPVEEDDEDRVHGGVRLQARRTHAERGSCRSRRRALLTSIAVLLS